MPNAVSTLRAPLRHALAFLLPLILGLTACGGGGDCIEEDPTTAAPLGTPSASSPSPASPTLPPIDDPVSAYLGQWAGPCNDILTQISVWVPWATTWTGEVTSQPGRFELQWVPSGRSERIGMEIASARPGVLTMTSTKRVYGNPTCNGAPEEIQQPLLSEATLVGTKFVDGQDTDKFEIRNVDGTRPQLMRIQDDRLYEGSFDFGSDPEGYPHTMQGNPSYERQLTAP